MSSAKNIPQWTHPFVSDKGRLAEIIKALEQQLVSLESAKDIIKREMQVESALSSSLDSLGTLVNHLRSVDKSDDDYRDELGFVVEDTATQTIEVVKSITEWVSGYTPTIEEYPTYPDVGPGAMRIRLPLNKLIYADDINAHVGRVKAAGVSLLIGHLDEFFEAFLESVLVDDYLFFALTAMFYDETVGWPILGGLGEWDFANWDTNVWDSGSNPSDVLLFYLYKDLYDFFEWIDFEDALSFIGVLYKSDDLTTLIDDLFFDGILYQTEDYAWANLDDALLHIGTLYIADDYVDTNWDDEIVIEALYSKAYDMPKPIDELDFIGILYETEDYAWANLLDELLAIGVLYKSEDLPNTPYAKIGTATLDTSIVGFDAKTYTSYDGWDSQKWDASWWDESEDTIYIIIKDVMI